MFSKKKKLTKKQVTDTILRLGTLNAKLIVDKLGQMDSLVPMSPSKLMEIDKLLTSAFKRGK